MSILINHKPDLTWAAKVFSDGGNCGRNPSLTGAWGFRAVSLAEDRSTDYAELVTHLELGQETVTNNIAELLGAVNALECVPVGWTGELWTDSRCTLYRLKRPRKAKMKNVPRWLVERLIAAAELRPAVAYNLLAGHPTKDDLRRGHTIQGVPVSRHNVIMDDTLRRMCESVATC